MKKLSIMAGAMILGMGLIAYAASSGDAKKETTASCDPKACVQPCDPSACDTTKCVVICDPSACAPGNK